jgi:FkbM family methyltransferase
VKLAETVSKARDLWSALRRPRTRSAGPSEIHPRVELRAPTLHLGTPYGGHAVDPRGLGPDSVVYSFGIGEDVSFDLALIERFGCDVYAFDPTPRSLAWLSGRSLPSSLHVRAWGVAGHDGTARFTPPADPEHVSATLLDRRDGSGEPFEAEVFRVATILRRLGHRRIDVLKLDVEGAEYTVLDDLLANGPHPGQILVEFHHHLPEVESSRTARALTQLSRAGYRIFHVSPDGHELSLRRAWAGLRTTASCPCTHGSRASTGPSACSASR